MKATSPHSHSRLMSRWHTYAQRVYREHHSPDNTMPSDLVPNAVWYYHTAHSMMRVRCLLNVNQYFERARVCSAPLNDTAIVVRVPPNPETNLDWYGFWLPQSHPGSCAGKHPEQLFLADDTWVEVIRIAEAHFHPRRRKREGGARGCWFFAAPGSGVFLHTGRSLRAISRSGLAAALNMTMPSNWSYGLDQLGFCDRAAALGFDTVQLWDDKYGERHSRATTKFWEHELISCNRTCLGERDYGPCTTLPLRTGIGASKPCMCNSSSAILNCDQTSPMLPPAAERPARGLGRNVSNVDSLSVVQHRRWCPTRGFGGGQVGYLS